MQADANESDALREQTKATSVVSTNANPGQEPILEPRVNPQQFNLVVGLPNQAPVHPDAIAGKLTGDHITQSIHVAEEKDRQSHEERKLSIYTLGAAFTISIVLVFALSWLFLAYHEPQLLEKVLQVVIAFASGAFGGFGVGKWSSSKPKAD